MRNAIITIILVCSDDIAQSFGYLGILKTYQLLRGTTVLEE